MAARIVGSMATATTAVATKVGRRQDALLSSYVRVLVSDDVIMIIKWTGLVTILVVAIFALGVGLGYMLGQKKGDVLRLPPARDDDEDQGRQNPETRDAQTRR